MSKRCPMCGGDELVDIVGFPGEFRCMSCGEELLERHLTRETVFTRITSSEEVLAEKLVYVIVSEVDARLNGYTSNIITKTFETYEEAFDATLAGLNALVESEVKDV